MKTDSLKVMFETFLSTPDLFFKLLPILKPELFETPYNRILSFVLDHYAKYKVLPDTKYLNAEFTMDFGALECPEAEKQCVLDEMEQHCQREAIKQLFTKHIASYNNNTLNPTNIWKEFQDINKLTLQKDIGLNQFADVRTRLGFMDKRIDARTTGWQKLDAMLGSIVRGEMFLVAAATSGGKSLFLANMAHNLSRQNLHGVIISLELNQELIAKRMDSIITGIAANALSENIDKVVQIYDSVEPHMGSIFTKKLSFGANANHIRNYIYEYYLQFKRYPDYCCVDYLDLMYPIYNNRNAGAFDRDKSISEELRDVFVEFNMYGFTASQLNRAAVDVQTPNHSHIAGGISKLNTCDKAIALTIPSEEGVEDENFIDSGERRIHLLKIRNGARHPRPISLWLDTDTLLLRDSPTTVKLPKATNIPQRKNVTGVTAALAEKLKQKR